MDKSEDRNRDMKKFFDEKLKTNNYQRVAGLDGKKIFASKLEGTFFEFPKTLRGRSIIDRSAGEYGCAYSHLKALQTFVTDKSNSDDLAIICEDDIDIFDGITSAYIQHDIGLLPKNWEIFQIQITAGKDINVPRDHQIFKWNVNTFGTCAYVIKRTAAQRLIDTFFIDNRFIIRPKGPAVADRFTSTPEGPTVADHFIYRNAVTYCRFPGYFYQRPFVDSFVQSDQFQYERDKWYPSALHTQKEIWKKNNRRPPRRLHNVRRKINKRFLPILY